MRRTRIPGVGVDVWVEHGSDALLLGRVEAHSADGFELADGAFLAGGLARFSHALDAAIPRVTAGSLLVLE